MRLPPAHQRNIHLKLRVGINFQLRLCCAEAPGRALARYGAFLDIRARAIANTTAYSPTDLFAK